MAVRTRGPRRRSKGPVDPVFGERLRRLRLQRGWTQEELAGDDFTKAFISHIERGRTRVSLRAASILAGRLGADVGELLAPKGGPALQAELELAVAEHQLAQGNPGAAVDRARAVRTSDLQMRARLRRVEGQGLIRSGRAREAIKALSEAAQAFRASGDDDLAVRASFELATAHAAVDEVGEAIGLLIACEQALAGGTIVDRTLELQVRSLLAVIYTRVGDAGSADLQAERALALAEDVVDEAALDQLYAGLMGTRREQGDLEGALMWARKALSLHEKGGREAAAVHAWNNLAWVYIERGQLERADHALRRAEGLRTETNPGKRTHLAVTRAKLELARGNLDSARALADSLVEDSSLLPTSRAQAQFIRARAIAASSKESLDNVRKAFDAAIAAYAREPARKRAQVHEAYADVLARRKQLDPAYAQAREALRLHRQGH